MILPRWGTPGRTQEGKRTGKSSSGCGCETFHTAFTTLGYGIDPGALCQSLRLAKNRPPGGVSGVHLRTGRLRETGCFPCLVARSFDK